MMEKETITCFVKADGAAQAILTEDVNNIKHSNLRDLLPFGFSIHAGKVVPCWRSHFQMDLFRFS